jgi:hypothetical protein
MLEWIFLIIKSFFLVPIMLIAALFNGVLCKIGVEAACSELEYNVEVLRSSALVAGVTIAVLVVLIPLLNLLIRKPDRIVSAIERFLTRLPHQIVQFLGWLHYVFVPHPAEKPILEARGSGSTPPAPIDEKELDERMVREVDERSLPPVYKTESQRRRAEAMRRLLDEEAKIFDSAEERERARRRMEHAKRGKV